MLESQTADLDRANALMMTFGASLSAVEYAELDRLIADLNINIPAIKTAGLVCWNTPAECITKKTELGYLLRPLNRAPLTMKLIIPAGYFSIGNPFAYYSNGNGTYCRVYDVLVDRPFRLSSFTTSTPVYPHGVKYRALLPLERQVLAGMGNLGDCVRPTNEIYANTSGHPYECVLRTTTPPGAIGSILRVTLLICSSSPAYIKSCNDPLKDLTKVLRCL